MLKLPKSDFYVSYEDILVKMLSLTKESWRDLVFILLLEQTDLELKFPVPTSNFPPKVREVITMVTLILGYEDDSVLDEVILILMNHIFPNSDSVSHKFDFTQLIIEAMHEELKGFEIYKVFRFQSYLFYLL
jgi:hypothetical protein